MSLTQAVKEIALFVGNTVLASVRDNTARIEQLEQRPVLADKQLHRIMRCVNEWEKSRDTDNDGLRDYDEYERYHTDPNQADTDGDGWNDNREIQFGTNPLDDKDVPSMTDELALSNIKLYLNVRAYDGYSYYDSSYNFNYNLSGLINFSKSMNEVLAYLRHSNSTIQVELSFVHNVSGELGRVSAIYDPKTQSLQAVSGELDAGFHIWHDGEVTATARLTLNNATKEHTQTFTAYGYIEEEY